MFVFVARFYTTPWTWTSFSTIVYFTTFELLLSPVQKLLRSFFSVVLSFCTIYRFFCFLFNLNDLRNTKKHLRRSLCKIDIQEEKHFNLQSVKLTFLFFSSIKHYFGIYHVVQDVKYVQS